MVLGLKDVSAASRGKIKAKVKRAKSQ